MNVRSRLLFVLFLLLLMPAAAAQERTDEPAPLVVMNLAAHPDDEDGLTLAYYRHAKDAVAHSVIYTRGEGGQNEIGPDLYERLGAIRTAETEAAARHLGTQVRFLNLPDFGYSKFAREAFGAWGGEDAVTERLVYLVRRLKPDVLFTNHDTVTVGPRTQHGHHQAVGVSAVRAFDLAADPAYHPEHLEEPGVDLWQPKRLFLRLWRGDPDGRADVAVPVGDVIPELGRSAADLAVAAAAEHRSQGFDKFAPRFRRDTTHFVLLRSARGVPPLPEDADDLAAGLAPNPHAAAADLAYLIDSGRAPTLPDGMLRLSDSTAVPGGTVELSWGRLPIPTAASPDHRLVLSGAVDTSFAASDGAVTLRIPAGAEPTLPKERAQYERYVSSPPAQWALRDPGGGLVAAGHLPLEIAPPLVLEVEEAVELPGGLHPRLLLRPGANRLTLTGRAFDPGVDAVRLAVTVVSRATTHSVGVRNLTVPVRDGRIEEAVEVELWDDLPAGAYAVSVIGRADPTPATAQGAFGSLQLEGQVLPPIAVAEGLRVGFVRSYDDATEAALREMGAAVVPLDSAALATGGLDGLDTIVLDIRAYLARQDLRQHNDRLLEWVRGGGHLVVMYQKTFEWNEGFTDPFLDGVNNPAGFAPLPLSLGRDRVTYEDAAVTALRPDHPLLRAPNRISRDDWGGWVQERGLYFPLEYDPTYAELFEMADPGEDPLRSSTLLAEVGEGTYLYTALGWYRQLAAFNPGAYRLVANLVSLPLVDGRRGG